jgi:hypothetical protein
VRRTNRRVRQHLSDLALSAAPSAVARPHGREDGSFRDLPVLHVLVAVLAHVVGSAVGRGYLDRRRI